MLNKQEQFETLVTALEGGSNYWYMLPDLSMVPKKGYTPKSAVNLKELQDNPERGRMMLDTLVHRVWEAISEGKEIPVTDIEDGEKLGVISKKTLNKGAQLLWKNRPKIVGSIKSGDPADAEEADIFLQYAVLGDIVYG